MNDDDAREVAKRLDPSVGETIYFTSENDIIHPHVHGKLDLGPFHTDGYAVRRTWGGLELAKIHDDDYERDVEPRFRPIF
jgi:hypothetical protein